MIKKLKKLAALALALTMTASLFSTAALAADIEENEYEPNLLIETHEPSLLIESLDEEIIIEEALAEKPCSVEFIYAAADAVDGAVAAPEGVSAPEKIENEQSFRLSEADLSYGSGEISEGYTFSGWYIEDSGNWYKLEDMLRFLIIYSHTEVYGYWTYTVPEVPEVPEVPNIPENKPKTPDNDSQTPSTPKPPVAPLVKNDDATINEVDIPLAPAPETEMVILDEVVPMGNLPQTGSNVSSISAMVIAILALASGLTVAGLTLVLASLRGKED